MIIKYIVEEDNILIKEYLKSKKLSSNFLKKVKLYGEFRLNQQLVKNYHPLKKGDILELLLEEELNQEVQAKKIDLNILYEDEWLMVISKPRDLACQPTRKHLSDNVISAIKYYFLENNITSNIHIVNRLDYSTTGLMIIAKCGFIHNALKQKQMTRKYIALVEGYLNDKKGIIDLPIGRDNEISIKRKISEKGKNAITEYVVLEESDNTSYLLLKLHTGRTHQIRLHLSHMGFSIVGDGLYGKESGELKLHCCYLEFMHPVLEKMIVLEENPIWYQSSINYKLI
ncbi:MAG: RluA family pseudouridine synthase [Bacilli bacterium]|nr:RluA family pseudouridine synthase [Bacilli bacterium]